MSTLVSVLDVAMDARTGGSEATYTYADPGGYELGQCLMVPLGPRSVIGFVVGKRTIPAEDLDFPVTSLRKPLAPVADVLLPAPLMEMVEFVAREYLCPINVALVAAVPPGLKDRLVTSWEVSDLFSNRSSLTPSQSETLRVMAAQGGKLVDRKTSPLTPAVRRTLRRLRELGLVRDVLSLSLVAEKSRFPSQLRLTPNAAAIEAFLSGPGRKRPAQAHLLITMQGSENMSFDAQELKSLSGCTDQTLRALLGAGLLEEVEKDVVVPPAPPTPHAHQADAIATIVEAIEGRTPETMLLFGVTGSGKTEVYLRAAKEALRLGRQVLFLVPEISLTPQVVAKLRERFGATVAVLHSNMSPTERLQSWFRARRGEAAVILGARSALFAPLDNVGLIIMDEEHESSYKQESAPRYHARTVAKKLAEIHGCPLVLGSATPSLESAFAAQEGQFRLLQLPYRAADAQLPSVEIVDLTEMYSNGPAPSILSESLHNQMVETLSAGHQAILFLNRRAYSPFLLCRECGHTWQCQHCSVALSFHQKVNILKCHHCNYQEPAPRFCPQCNGMRINPLGIGTQRVEEMVRETFPGVRVARLDRDVAQKKGALEEILAQFRTGEIDVLVGTQMVAKGLDFPNVTLVGVIAADTSLNLPDFRASERTFQLLSQVAGRAGRGVLPGHVIVQTFNPNHEAIVRARDHDYYGFYEKLLHERREAGYPPFLRLVNIVFSGPDLTDVTKLSVQAVAQIRQYVEDADVMGPVECTLFKLKDQFRLHCLVKLPLDVPNWFVADALSGLSCPKGTNLLLDVDPYSMT